MCKKGTIAVLDFECTGRAGSFEDEPWQVGVVLIQDGRVDPDSRLESLLHIDPDRPFNPHAPGRHARLRGALALAPSPAEFWPELAPWITGRALCAHNVATERRMLRRMAPLHRFGPWIDTLRLARRAWPDLAGGYALENLIEALGLTERLAGWLPGRAAHDALYDAFASALLLEHLWNDPAWGRLTISDLAALSRGG